MKKRFLILIAGLLILSLAACAAPTPTEEAPAAEGENDVPASGKR